MNGKACERSCWECRYVVTGGLRFVNDFLCNHPQNKEDVHAVPLKAEELEEGCDLYESKDSHTEGDV